MKLAELLPAVMSRGRLREIKDELRGLRNTQEFYAGISAADLLTELDPSLMDMITSQLGWDRLSYFERADENARKYAVRQARYRFRRDPLVRGAIKLNTYFGFGQTVTITPTDEGAQEPWADFWAAKGNRSVLSIRNLHKLSDLLQQDGELFFGLWTSTLDGTVKVRRVNPDEITAIALDPDDQDMALHYLRSRTVNSAMEEAYYPRWDASAAELNNAKREDGIKVADAALTDIRMMHVAINSTDLRGWPIVSTSLPWGQYYDDFMQDRVAVAAMRAMYVNKLKYKGGSRARDALKSVIDSSLVTGGTTERNPRAVAASTWLENEAATLSQLDQRTGAQDAKADGLMLVGQFGVGVQQPPFLLGRPDSAQNRSTAEMTMMPTVRMWQEYQLFWGSVWRDLVDFVLTMKETYANKKFDSHEANVSTDAEILVDLQVLISGLSEAVLAGAFPVREAVWILLRRPEFGIAEPDEVFTRLYPPEEEPTEKQSSLQEALALVVDLAAEAGKEGDEEALAMAMQTVEDMTA